MDVTGTAAALDQGASRWMFSIEESISRSMPFVAQTPSAFSALQSARQSTTLRSLQGWSKIMSVSELRTKTVGHRKIEGSNVWSAVQQLTETAERIRGTRALVPRGVQRFTTFEEAHELSGC